MRILSLKTGFSLIELMVAVSLSSVAALGVMSLQTALNKSTVSANSAAQADGFRKQVSALLSNISAWRNTVNNNAGVFSCISTDCTAQLSANHPSGGVGTYTDPSPTGIFNVYDTSGANYYPIATDATRGFNTAGIQCTGFSQATPNPNCSYRLVLWWVPICPSTTGACKNPLVHVFGYTLYSPVTTNKEHNIAFNPNNYGVNLVLSPNP